MDLKNIKSGQSRTLEDGTTVINDDTSSAYLVVPPGGQGGASLYFDKAQKSWMVVYPGAEATQLVGATAKTAVTQLLAEWPQPVPAEPSPAPQADDEKPAEPTDDAKRAKVMDRLEAAMKLAQDPSTSAEEAEAALAAIARMMERNSITEEELRRRTAEAKGTEAGDEPLSNWTWNVNMLGGHGPHRIAAYASVASAMGGGVFYVHHKPKGVGYRFHTITLHVIAQESVIKNIETLFVVMELQMERLAEAKSKAVSRDSRLAGKHHSGPGCHARRGFMRGFGAGIASRIRAGKRAMEQEDSTGSTALVLSDRSTQVEAYMREHHSNLKTTKPQKFDEAAWAEGHAAGVAFASPAVTGEEPARQLQDA